MSIRCRSLRARAILIALLSATGGLAVAPQALAGESTGGPVAAFGDDGRGVLDGGIGMPAPSAIATDGAGRVLVAELAVVANTVSSDPVAELRVTAFSPTGSVDTTFGDRGTWSHVGPHVAGLGVALALDGADRPVLALETFASDPRRTEAEVWRLTAGGAPDPTFDGDGFVRLAGPPGFVGAADVLALRALPDRIVLVTASTVFGLTPDGRLDASYGDAGTRTLSGDRVAALAGIDATGAALLLHASAERAPAYALRRIDAGGLDDLSYGSGGAAPAGAHTGARSLSVDDSGRAVAYLGGRMRGWTRTGQPDVRLGGDQGFVPCSVPPAHRAMVHARGDTVALVTWTVFTNDPAALAIVATDPDGAAPSDSCTQVVDPAPGAVVLDDGRGSTRLLVAGITFLSGTNVGAVGVAALGLDAVPQTGFGDGGIARALVGTGSEESVSQLVEDAAGRTLVLGGTGNGSVGLVARLLPDGAPDPAYGFRGRAHLLGHGVVRRGWVRPDGSLTVMTDGRGQDGPTLVRLTSAGRVDATFGGDGGVELSALLGVPSRRIFVDEEGSTILVGVGSDSSTGTGMRRLLALDSGTGLPAPRFGGTATAEAVGIRELETVVLLGARAYASGAPANGELSDRGALRCWILGTGAPCLDVGPGGLRVTTWDYGTLVASGSELVSTSSLRWFNAAGDLVGTAAPHEDHRAGFASGYSPGVVATDVRADGSVTRVMTAWADAHIGVTRYLPHGALDRSFGDDGHLVLEDPMRIRETGGGVVAKSDGTLAVAVAREDIAVHLRDLRTYRPISTVSVADAVTDEGGELRFRITFDPPTITQSSLRVAVEHVTTVSGDLRQSFDVSQTHSVPAGLHDLWVAVPTLADGLPESTETLRLRIEAGYPLQAGRVVATGTVRNVADHPGPAPAAPVSAGLHESHRGSLTVWWESPLAIGAAPVAGYLVVTKQAGVATGWELVASDVRRTSVSVPSNGRSHQVEVTAFNVHGVGPPAPAGSGAPSDAPVGTPDRAEDVSVAPGRSSLRVSWSAGNLDDGGAPVRGYAVVATYDDELLAWRNVGPDVRQATLPGITGFAQVSVVPYNKAGFGHGYGGQYTLPSDAAPAPAPPGAPAYVMVDPLTGGRGKVWWGASTDDGGAPIAGYSVVALQSGRVVAWRNVGPDARTVQLSGLPTGQPTEVVVVPHNRIGFGSAGSPVATPRT